MLTRIADRVIDTSLALAPFAFAAGLLAGGCLANAAGMGGLGLLLVAGAVVAGFVGGCNLGE
jgi:hypothetical protein